MAVIFKYPRSPFTFEERSIWSTTLSPDQKKEQVNSRKSGFHCSINVVTTLVPSGN